MQELAVVTEASFGIRDSKPLVTLELKFLGHEGGVELTPIHAADVLLEGDWQFLEEMVGAVVVIEIDQHSKCHYIKRFTW